MNEIDFGVVYVKKTGSNPRIKVMLNKFRDTWYVHIREWNMDGDTGKLFATSKGIALDPDELDALIDTLQRVSDYRGIKYKHHNQYTFDFGDIKEE